MGFSIFRTLGATEPVTGRLVTNTALESLLASYTWAALTPLIFWVAHRWGIDGPRAGLRIVMLVGLGLAISALMMVEGEVVDTWVIEGRAPEGWDLGLRDIVR